jgi:hypothetical protein
MAAGAETETEAEASEEDEEELVHAGGGMEDVGEVTGGG